MIRGANLGLRFALELCALTALGYWGFASSSGAVQWLLGLGAPALAATAWGLFVAPKASHPLVDPPRLVVELAVFGSASVGLAAAGRTALAAGLAAAVAIHLCLTFALEQRRPGTTG